ncbi:GntR family transcriptional regulator [Brassicibacter mesophilus]|uniref:GntR family transcriptional regulator n=1 Tax=Brassicibacter mesophilus TaxID=745119 RepID=UPI003D19ED04
MKIKEKSIPLSQKAKEKIIEYIREEGLQPDDTLPSEANLMDMLGVSRYTVREALALLEQDKIVYKIQGKGTFVNKRPVQIESGLEKLESITEIIESFGYDPGTEWIDIKENVPTKDMINELKMNEDEKVITFKRIRTASGKVAAYCVDTIKKSMLIGDVPENVDNESMFSYLKEMCGMEPEYAISEILPTFPTKEMVELMKINKKQLFILLHQVHYDKEGNPLIYSMDYFNPDVFKFKVNRVK